MLLTEPGKLVKALDFELGFDRGDVEKGFPGKGRSMDNGMEA